MAIRNYVGARYVPKFADPVEWQANTSYEAMVIVTYNNASYTSKVPVPPTVGNPAENSTYWALTGNYNAQVEEYRKATAEAQEHARDGICAVDEGNNTTATKSHKAHEYFWWKGKLYRAKEAINVGALLNDGGNAEEGNVADGVSVNSTDIYTLKGTAYHNSNSINLLTDDITNHNNRIRALETNVDTNTNDISTLKTKTDTNTNDINSLKTKDTEIEGKVNTNTNDISELKSKTGTNTNNINALKSKDTELQNAISTETTNRKNEDAKLQFNIDKKVNINDFRYGDFYKNYTLPSSTTTHTTSGVSMMIARDGSDLTNFPTEQGKIFLPIMAEYTYYASKDDYDNGRAQKLNIGYYTITPYQTGYLIKYSQNENFTSWLERLEVIGLVIKIV